MEMSEIRRIFAKVIHEALETVTPEAVLRGEYYNPAIDLEELIPDLRKVYLDKPGYDGLSAAYNLVDIWADAVSHGFEDIGCRKYPLKTSEAEPLLLEAARAFEQNLELTEHRVLEWYRQCLKPRARS